MNPIVSPDGRVVYAITNSTEIVRVQITGGEEATRWRLGEPLTKLAITDDGQMIYAACQRANKVLVLDAGSGNVLSEIQVDSPCDILLTPKPARLEAVSVPGNR